MQNNRQIRLYPDRHSIPGQSAGQEGSIILMIIIIAATISMLSVMVLQAGTMMSRQTNLQEIYNHAKSIVLNEIALKINELANGVDFGTLPENKTKSVTLSNSEYLLTRHLADTWQSNLPLPGFSLNSLYRTRHIELKSRASTSMAQSPNSVYGMACAEVISGNLPNQRKSVYSIDTDDDSIVDVSYQFDSENGDIWRTGSKTELLIHFDLNLTQQFSQADFTLSIHDQKQIVVIAFVIQNIDGSSQTDENNLYILFNGLEPDSSASHLISTDELIDLSLNQLPTNEDKGYVLGLDSGQLLISAMTSYNHNIIFITQELTTDPVTGFVMYKNKLLQVDLKNSLGIFPMFRSIADSDDLLRYFIITTDNTQTTFGTQYDGGLLSFPGMCVKTYYYEN